MKRFLVPFDGSEQARRALEYALTEHADEELTALYVLNPAEWGYGSPNSGFGKRWYEEAKDESEKTRSDATALATEHGVEIATAEEVGVPSDVITEYAGEHDIDHIIIGSHGRSGTKRLVLGSVAEAVARNVSIPVTIIG
ncbi:MAG TPA: universal stress protein [Halococcus sp.]|nr:universal stress protein [Halococcus sp.]